MGGVRGSCCIAANFDNPYVKFIFVLRVKPFYFEGQRHFSQRGRLLHADNSLSIYPERKMQSLRYGYNMYYDSHSGSILL